MYMFMCMHVHKETRGQHWLLNHLSTLEFWDKVYHGTWSSLIQLDWPSNSINPPISTSLVLGLQKYAIEPGFLSRFWESNSVLHVHIHSKPPPLCVPPVPHFYALIFSILTERSLKQACFPILQQATPSVPRYVTINKPPSSVFSCEEWEQQSMS